MIKTPSKKSKKVDDGMCPLCGKDSTHVPLRNDSKSIDEFLLRGTCQMCQDGKTKKRIEC